LPFKKRASQLCLRINFRGQKISTDIFLAQQMTVAVIFYKYGTKVNKKARAECTGFFII